MRSVYANTLRWGREAKDPGPVDHPSRPVQVAVPVHVARESRLLLSDMASMVAGEALARCPGKDTFAPDQIIVCATSFEHDFALSCAGRLHSELRSKGAPFAIEQLQGVSFFVALQVVANMMANLDHMRCALIVGAERWLPPFTRLAGSLTALGDGAAAALVLRHARPAWHVLSVNVCTPSATAATLDTWIDETAVVEIIEQTCAQAGLTPDTIDWIVPPRIDATLACRVSAQARLAAGQIWYPSPEDIGYLCAADAPAQFDALLRSAVPSEGQRVLLWSAGLQGQAACAILQYRGSPQ